MVEEMDRLKTLHIPATTSPTNGCRYKDTNFLSHGPLKKEQIQHYVATVPMRPMRPMPPAVAPAEKPKIAVNGHGDERDRSSSTVRLAKACKGMKLSKVGNPKA